MAEGLRRGSVWVADLPMPSGRRPVVVLTRDLAIPLLRDVTIVHVTRTRRELPTTVPVGPEEGLADDCNVNADNVATIPKDSLRRRVGELGPAKLEELARAVRVALDV